MKILHILKKIMVKSISFMKLLLKEYIPISFQSTIEDKKIKNILKKINITEPKKWNVKKWHFKYRYYEGKLNGERVFIKISTRKSWIKHEYDINKYIEDSSELLASKKARIFLYEEIGRYGILVEEFISYNSIKNTGLNIENGETIIENLISIVEELQRISLVYMDFYEDNIYVDNKNNVKLIDFGFSLRKDQSICFIGNEHLRDMIFKNVNPAYRLDVGIIDDTISVLCLLKKFIPEFMILYPKQYKRLNEISNKIVFNYGDYKNENK